MPQLPSALPTFDSWLRSLPAARLEQLAGRFAQRAAELGLAVTLPDGGERPIPPMLTPVVVDPEWIAQSVEGVERLTRMVRSVAVGLLGGAERAAILEGLFPFERTCVEARGVPEVLATVRADLFLDPPHARALELNTTIPAMQGYSDIAARAFIEALAPDRAEALVSQNGENAMALWASLSAFHRRRTGRELERIALVHRPLDSQLSELRYLARRWERSGARCRVVEVEALSFDASGVPQAAGEPVDLVYRHIFARRVEPAMGLAHLLLTPGGAVANSVSAPLELKRVFAELSRSLDEPEYAARFQLAGEDLARVRTLVPWTRPLAPGPASVPGGARVEDLVEHVATEPARYVIKRSWDYGGKAVFLGFEADSESTLERAEVAFGERLRWPHLVRRAAADSRGGGFVVQERIVAEPAERLRVGPEGPRWSPMYEDFSVFASLGLPAAKWGGVCRASASAIVNIAGGGGVAPVVSREVAAALLQAIGAAR